MNKYFYKSRKIKLKNAKLIDNKLKIDSLWSIKDYNIILLI